MEQENKIEELKETIGRIINDAMYHILDEYDSRYLAEELIDKGYRKANEVAEEIFAEIEKMLLNNHIGHYKTVKDTWCYNFNNEIISEIAELKKKYAED